MDTSNLGTTQIVAIVVLSGMAFFFLLGLAYQMWAAVFNKIPNDAFSHCADVWNERHPLFKWIFSIVSAFIIIGWILVIWHWFYPYPFGIWPHVHWVPIPTPTPTEVNP